jgi:hypothetical protein
MCRKDWLLVIVSAATITGSGDLKMAGTARLGELTI